ncbi:ribose 5-phosphate isomerase B [bacterium]|jgi:ribose 5-phosphate isomerase B|nr:ribose 5-phosphate isomerase B [Flavobacteriaceae bacterium]MDB0041222.1 ribose 5-phosphate isomerase B [bacterium]MDA9257168.1 ribose 5-phosphate isomerase B [Flavobacteriaceae bacterium]MDA9373305.1 ribose 5-phosphate isomerase B [Flavobacteriaceae bacterium]MDA9374679.1 ribose 5-phosphate isomerase B [Flavobacteriaceae bacterium]
MKIAIGNDHAGTEYKKEIQKMLLEDNHVINNHGTDDDKSVDYPDHIHPVASQVENNEVDFGIIICGSGNGANMTANKHQKIRSALCWSKEIATLSRTHNNANILSIPSRFVSLNEAKEMVNSFLNTSFEGGRHQTRVNKIPK